MSHVFSPGLRLKPELLFIGTMFPRTNLTLFGSIFIQSKKEKKNEGFGGKYLE